MLAAFVVAVKDDLTGQLKEGERCIEVCGFRGILVCCVLVGKAWQWEGLCPWNVCLTNTHRVAEGDLSKIPLPHLESQTQTTMPGCQCYSGSSTSQTIILWTSYMPPKVYILTPLGPSVSSPPPYSPSSFNHHSHVRTQ